MHLSYLDFELEIGVGQGRDLPVVVRSPAGEARAILHFPFDELALESRLKDLQIALLRSGGNRRQTLSSEQQAVRTFGQALFDALFSGEVRSRYDVSLQQARSQGKGLRIRLQVQSPTAAVVPWEYLYDPRQSDYCVLSVETPIMRYLELPQPITPLAVAPPLRMLAMLASPTDLPVLDTAQEKLRIERSLDGLCAAGRMELEWLSGQTWRDLQGALRRGPWHVFHFSGHGRFDPFTDEGQLIFADDQGRARVVPASDVGRLLANHRTLRLAWLNACEGARGSEQDIFSSAASILVRRGIPAVVAMQYEITDRAAIELARTFYEAVADGYPVDAALAEARVAVSLVVNNTVEWGTPALYVRAPDGVLFDMTTPIKVAQALIDTASQSRTDAAPVAERSRLEPQQAEPITVPAQPIIGPARPATDEESKQRAQQALDKIWVDWQAKVGMADQSISTLESLVDANQLAELRINVDHVTIGAPQYCLLLHSAVRHHADIPFWAQRLAHDAPTKMLLRAIEYGETGQDSSMDATALATVAIGLTATGPHALARAGTSHPVGHVRHTASLALAATGLDHVNQSLPALVAAIPRSRRWRRVQALAQMQSAGFAVPQTSLALHLLVAVWGLGLGVWHLGLGVWRNRWPMLIESMGAGIGAAVGLMLALLINVLASPSELLPLFLIHSQLFLAACFGIGTVTVTVAWVVVLAGSGGSSRSRAVRQVIGVWLGFVLGLLLFSWSLEAFFLLAVESSQLDSGLPRDRGIVGTYVIGGSLWALGIALGQQLLAGRGTSLLRALLGAGIGGAAGCLAAWLLGIGVPLVEPVGGLALVQVALAGFGLGGGLVAGRVMGTRIWRVMRLGPYGQPYTTVDLD